MQNKKTLKLMSKKWIKHSSGMVFRQEKISERIELHWHDFFELEIILGGSGYQLLNGRRIELKRGIVYLMRLTDFHEIIPESEMVIYNLKMDERVIPKNLLNILLKTKKDLCFELEEKELSAVQKLFDLCVVENSLPTADIEYIKNIISCILIKIFKNQQITLPQEKLSNKKALQQALLYLDMHFREDPSLSQIAKISHYNPNHFSTAFHNDIGVTYSEYLNNLKISYAKKLLLSTDLRVCDIGYESGFSSVAHFLKTFKEHVGISPLRFRNISRK